MRKRAHDVDEFHVAGVAERLRPYQTTGIPALRQQEPAQEELVERAAALLSVMPRNQLRKTIEGLLSPHDAEQGRLAIDALIDAAFAIEDETGHLRKIDSRQ